MLMPGVETGEIPADGPEYVVGLCHAKLRRMPSCFVAKMSKGLRG